MSAVRANIAANLAGQAWSVVLALACTPFYIGILGVEAYGLVAFFLVVQNILQLLDLGLGSALNRQIARSGKTAIPELADFLATAEAWYWILGAAMAAAIFAGMPTLVRWWLNPQSLPVSEDQLCGARFRLHCAHSMAQQLLQRRARRATETGGGQCDPDALQQRGSGRRRVTHLARPAFGRCALPLAGRRHGGTACGSARLFPAQMPPAALGGRARVRALASTWRSLPA